MRFRGQARNPSISGIFFLFSLNFAQRVGGPCEDDALSGTTTHLQNDLCN